MTGGDRAGNREDTWAVIAGGGTAGHTIPGICIARALVERGHPASSIHFVGSERGSEAELVPEAGFGITTLPGRGIQRRLTLDNVAAVVGLIKALGQGLALLRRRRPQVVVSLGGFASIACGLGAAVLRIPIVVAEQNARAGAANRVVGRFAKVAAVPFAATDLPRAVVTGNPVRPDMLAVDRDRDRDSARELLGLPPDRMVVAVCAGSLGSTRINQAVFDLVERWAHRGDVAIHHVLGRRDWERLGDALPRPSDPAGVHYQAVEYENRMPQLMVAADLLVGRSGGSTVAELAVVGLGGVMVPLPIAPRDHQTANATDLVQAGAVVVVPDAEFDGDRLVAELDELLEPAKLRAMADAARSIGRPDAARAVAELVEGAAT
ncbi:MAG: UDP-N-acetylglucosamine--N-acetylmuramyl-(pentapeptide) pyrophosphoryl-undecaprenol N-acetylglucosamine transferase [Actinomycetia bacterium]|nr:UDP-N-acetylglucosamine--N-acetylmuramyl-(pentapeptide) pyrophosphoryl-undecaprenol N-acetylglucosamine transferase [Actinomycetes bacterium]